MAVERNRNGGKWSEAQYYSAIRSALRRGFRWWKPAVDAKLFARRPYSGGNRRQKWEYICSCCGEWFKDKDVQIDHITPVGSLRRFKGVC